MLDCNEPRKFFKSIFHLLGAYFVSLNNLQSQKNLFIVLENLFKFISSMWLFNIIDTNSKKMFILNIEINNISKCNV
jgi:hypothetical protein